MRAKRKIILSIAGAGTLAVSASMAALAWGHGYTSDPPSRSALCASGDVADCGAISYEPQSVEGPKGFPAAGPADGEICSAGHAEFAELDDPRGGNWPATAVAPGARTFTWTMTAAHSTATFDYYLTDDDDYDPTRPLTRDMLDLEPFASFAMGGARPEHEMSHQVTLPERSGRHLILSVWNIADTVNAFYSCVDVDFGGGGEEPPTSAPTTGAPTDPPTGDPDCGAWDAAAVYTAGDTVTHGGTAYRAGWWTTGEEPGTTGEWGVWKPADAC
jgi:predicted carbohydrate-binding protein with CBM5 and CBM33 domain